MDAVPPQFQMPGIPHLGFEANSLHDSFLWALLQTAVSSEFNWSSHARTDPKTTHLLRTSVSFNAGYLKLKWLRRGRINFSKLSPR